MHQKTHKHCCVDVSQDIVAAPVSTEFPARDTIDELIDCFSGQELFQVKADDTKQRAIQRVSQLEPHLRDFVLRVRLREGHLSKAVLTGTTKYASEWHLSTHELAKARMYSMVSGQRQSRAAAWFNVQASICPAPAAAGQANSWSVRPVQRYKPYTAEDLQVLVYTAADKTIQLGVVLCVYRGAIVTSKKGTRSLRASKPSAVPLTGHLCKAVRIAQLTQYSTSSFFACNFSNFELVEVLGHVHAEACPRRSDRGLDLLRMSFSSEVLDAVRYIQNNPASLMTIKETGAAQPEKDSIVGPRNFGAGDFARSTAGCKNVEDCLALLPSKYREAKMELLDKEGYIQCGSERYLWTSICKRAPEFYDQRFQAHSGRNYGKQILSHLLQLLPEQHDANNRVRHWSAMVAKETLPLPHTQNASGFIYRVSGSSWSLGLGFKRGAEA